MKLLLPLLLFISISSIAQSSDFLLLKKGSKTVHAYYAGTQIEFLSNTGAYLSAQITEVKKDSLYLQEFIIQKMITKFGFYILDTLGSYRYRFHYNQIVAIGQKKEKGFSWSGSGAGLIGGSALLSLGSLVVLVVDKEKFSPGLLVGSLALGGLGYLISKTSHHPLKIGKKYHLLYMKAQ